MFGFFRFRRGFGYLGIFRGFRFLGYFLIGGDLARFVWVLLGAGVSFFRDSRFLLELVCVFSFREFFAGFSVGGLGIGYGM